MSSDKVFITTIIALVVISANVFFREPIFNFNIQTTLQFDIFTVVFAYILGFLMATLSQKKENKADSNELQR
jgi:hypothetical protein